MSGEEPTRKRAGSTATAFARQWGGGEDNTPAPHPAPEVALRDATEAEIGRSPRAMRKLAQGAGWAVRVTYSRGTTMTAKGKPGKVVDAVAVRMHAVNRLAWGVWHNGSYDSGQIWERGFTVPRNVGATELSAFVAAHVAATA